MADDIQDLDSSDILRIEPNAVNNLSGDLKYFRSIIEYLGTSKKLESFSDDVLRSWDLEFLFCEFEDEFNFLQFWHDQKGDLKKFWYITNDLFFDLTDEPTAIDTSFVVVNNAFDKVYTGEERICIMFKDNTILTRKIISVVDIGNKELRINFNTAFGVNILFTQIKGVYQITPVRFDQKTLTGVGQSKVVADYKVRIKEVREFPP